MARRREGAAMARCPRCGGAENRQISVVGFFECTSLVQLTGVPGTGPPGHPPYAAKVCRHRFQVGTGVAVPSCSHCGLYAVGACDECHLPVCGDHGRSIPTGFLCAPCVNTTMAEAATKAALEMQAARARDEAEHKAANVDALDQLRRLTSVPSDVALIHDQWFVASSTQTGILARLKKGDVCPHHGAPCTVSAAGGLTKLQRLRALRFRADGLCLLRVDAATVSWSRLFPPRYLILVTGPRIVLAIGDEIDLSWNEAVDIQEASDFDTLEKQIRDSRWATSGAKENADRVIPRATNVMAEFRSSLGQRAVMDVS